MVTFQLPLVGYDTMSWSAIQIGHSNASLGELAKRMRIVSNNIDGYRGKWPHSRKHKLYIETTGY